MSEFRESIARISTPEWARLLTDDDEWVVRTALANVASDLDRALAAIPPDDRQPVRRAITDSIRRYKDVLDRIETAA
jgi:acyl-CoA reductase-like NAD-dependent aldehyde dehydrogenase